MSFLACSGDEEYARLLQQQDDCQADTTLTPIVQSVERDEELARRLQEQFNNDSMTTGASISTSDEDQQLAQQLQDRFDKDRAGALNPHLAGTATAATSEDAAPSIFKKIWRSVSGQSAKDDEARSMFVAVAPQLWRDCTSKPEKLAWLHSPQGQLLLSKRPVLNELYQTGRLIPMISNLHWAKRLDEWFDEEKVPFGMNLRKSKLQEREEMPTQILISANPHNMPAHLLYKNRVLPPMHFPTTLKYDILTDGFCVFHGLVPRHIADAAELAINAMLVNSPGFAAAAAGSKEKITLGTADPFFETAGTNDQSVLDLFYLTQIYPLVDALLHGNEPGVDEQQHHSINKAPPAVHTYTGGAQVAYRFSEARTAGDRSVILGGVGWHIDGLDKGQFGSFALLIGVALNDQTADFCGNLCVHPGSHYALRAYIKEYATIILNSGSDNISFSDPKRVVAQKQLQNRPDLGEPVQVKLLKGDVVFVLHKVAHRGAPNYSPNVRKMVYFRVSHKDHNSFRMQSLDDIWMGYEGLTEVL